MKMTKRLLAIFLVIVLLASVVPAASAKHFNDVPSSIGEIYLDAINYVSDNGIMGGTGVNTFSPEAPITRAMFVLILFRLSEDTGTYTNASMFVDVPSTSYYYNAIGWAVQNGIAGGTSVNTFEPDKNITREQLMTMLYRFAGYFVLPQDADEDLTQAADYSSLSSYAYTPMSWAYEYGIVMRASNTEKIWPISIETRKNTALYIARFLRNLEGIDPTRDAFNFSNSESCFISASKEKVLISQNDWSLIYDLAVSQGVSSSTLNSRLNQEWSGSCYSMAMATILDYYGKIDFNGNYCNNIARMSDVPVPSDLQSPIHKLTTACNANCQITVAESKINMYQHSQIIPSVADWTTRIDPNTCLREMVSKLDHSGIGLFCYSFKKSDNKTYAHAVVAYGKPTPISNGYEIKVYDNRNFLSSAKIVINTTASNWTGRLVAYNTQETFINCTYRDNFSVYNILDPDGYDNTIATYSNQSPLSDLVVLSIRASGDFTVTNADGHTFSLSQASMQSAATADASLRDQASTEAFVPMQTYGMTFIPEGDTCLYMILVDPSTAFSCVASDGAQVSQFCVDGAGLEYSAVSMVGLDNALVCSVIEGQNEMQEADHEAH